jgi:hypothetical protein
MTKTFLYPAQEIPQWQPYDVLVCGGGPAGCAAALASVRQGLHVLVLEGQGQLGGTGTSGLVSHWLGGRFPDGRWVVGGIFRELAEEAAACGIALLPTAKAGQTYTPHGWYLDLVHGVPFDPFEMACFLDEKMKVEGVDVLLSTQVVDVLVKDHRITHGIAFNKSGLQAIPARALVDASGDADIAVRSGCEIVKGREEDGLMTPATLEFHVDNVDQDALSDYIRAHQSPRFRALIEELRAEGIWKFPYDIFISVQLNAKGTMLINTTRITGVDGTDGVSLSEGLVRGRAELKELFTIMRRYFPGFANAQLKAVAPQLGIRETRRIVGDYVLTVDDLISGTTIPDTIGYTMYGWDLPDPHKPSFQPLHEQRVPKPPVTPIPYRVMVPKPITNLICPGRAVSVERHVLGPLRVMAPVMAMGEAAGTAAAQVVREGIAFSAVDIHSLRDTLQKNGAILNIDS